MHCPNCGEHVTLSRLIKHTIWMLTPHRVHVWLDERKEKRELERLRDHYNKYSYATMVSLTSREDFVCEARTQGHSFEDIAKQMNVTRERIRQIQAKALRKLERANDEGVKSVE